MVVVLVNRLEGEELVLIGNFTKAELQAYRVDGYRPRQINKHGILRDRDSNA